jgi:hypothetical protein
MEYLKLAWQDIEDLCKNLAKLVKSYDPEIIIGIARGGWVPARILSDLLGIKELTSMRVEYYSGVGERRKKPRIVYPLKANVKGKRVLIVDDVADTGHSLEMVKEDVLKKGAKVKIATLHYKPWSVIKPDFYVKTTRAWIIYPWEVAETAKILKAKGKRELERAGIKEEDYKL